MKFSKRQVDILYYLNECEDITIKKISNKLGVTPQTVKAELTFLSDILYEYNVEIEYSSGKGIKVYNRNNLQKLLKMMKSNLEIKIKKQIIVILCLNRDFIILQDLADKLFISKSQAEKIIATILKEYDKKIIGTRHYGYKFCGTEFERRKIIVELISPYISSEDIEAKFIEFSKNYFNICEYFKKNILKKSLKILDYILNTNHVHLTGKSIQQLFLYIMIILENRNIEEEILESELVSYIYENKGFLEYIDIVKEINFKFNLNLSLKEIDYLAYILLILNKNKKLNKDETLLELKNFVSEVLNNIYLKFNINLLEDVNLIDNLSSHIHTSTLASEVLKQDSENLHLMGIKSQYPLAYEMATITCSMLKNKFGYAMNDYEMVCIALHFQISIEKYKKDTNIINTFIVSDLPKTLTSLIKTKLERLYPQINIINIYSVREYLVKNEIAELIISTENIKEENSKVIYISPYLKDFELEIIYDFIRVRDVNFIIKESIDNCIIINEEGNCTKEEIIFKMVQPLLKNKDVTKEYLETVYRREEISSTANNIIALPHGTTEYVKNVRLVITRIKNEIEWGENKVKFVFLLTFNKKILQKNSNFFSFFYKKVAQINFEMQLLEIEDKDDEQFKLEFRRIFT